VQVMRRVNDGNGNIDFEGLDVFALYSGVPPEEQTLNRRSRWIEVQSSPPLGGKQSPGSCRTLSRVPETWKVIPLGRNQEHYEPWNRVMGAEDLAEDQRATMHDLAGERFYTALSDYFAGLNISVHRNVSFQSEKSSIPTILNGLNAPVGLNALVALARTNGSARNASRQRWRLTRVWADLHDAPPQF